MSYLYNEMCYLNLVSSICESNSCQSYVRFMMYT
ncbi:hypothetical protein VPHK406_0072 [Vibrio phage K406]